MESGVISAHVWPGGQWSAGGPMNDGRGIARDGMSEDEAFAVFTYAGVSMVLTNPNLPDNPIVYINEAFTRTTGYPLSAAIGRNCRFLQGPDTDPDHVLALRRAIGDGYETTVDILNYRMDGTPFRNRLLIAPVRDAEGRITYFLGIQKTLTLDETQRSAALSAHDALREMHHRVKNHLAMIVGLIQSQARSASGQADAQADYQTLARRVASLQLLYEELNDARPGAMQGEIDLGAYLGRVASAVQQIDGRDQIRLDLGLDRVMCDVDRAGRVGLILSEIITNAMEHAFEGRETGTIRIALARPTSSSLRLVVSDDGAGLPPGVTWPDRGSMGGRIVRGLVQGEDGHLSVESGPGGTVVTLDLPMPTLRRQGD